MEENHSKCVEEFFTNYPSYLSCGNLRIQDRIKELYGETVSFEAIKKIKKKKKKKYEDNKPSRKNAIAIKPVESISEELIRKLKQVESELAKMKLQANPDIVGLKKRKLPNNVFTTPDLKNQVGMHILLGCNHVPFHHVRLHDNIMEMMSDRVADIVGFHLLGDFLDLNPLSSHDKGKFTAVPGLTLDDEYQVGNDLLTDFGRIMRGNVWKTYLYGNHEDRWKRWMRDMNNSKTPLMSPEDGLGLYQKGYNVKTSWSQDYITIGKDFDIFHGIYFNIHNAKKHLDTFNRNCAYVHTHRVQSYREGTIQANNMGACANFNSPAFNYASRAMKASWSNGFGVLMIDDNYESHFTQIVPAADGSFYFGGKKYKK